MLLNRLLKRLRKFFLGYYLEIYYINGPDNLPAPLSREQETAIFMRLEEGDPKAKEILITHYSSSFYTHDALVAGYAEIGETIEETVHREVKEETGLNVKNLVYYKSQPWSFSQTLLFGFFCEVDGDDTIHMDQNELKYAAWHKTSDTFDLPDTASLTAEMIHYIKTK